MLLVAFWASNLATFKMVEFPSMFVQSAEI